MRVLDAGDVLDLCDRGAALGTASRALMLLEAAYPEAAPGAIGRAPLSARDRALLAVRASLFGTRMWARDSCGDCGEILELAVTAEAIGLGPADDLFPPSPEGRLSNGAAVHAVTAGDAVAAEAGEDVERASALLAMRVAPAADDWQELDSALEALDPSADVEIALACPTCGETSIRSFDAPAFVWGELQARVPRILRDVVDLAQAFHWSEQAILAMPAERRAFYLAEVRT